MKPEEHIKRAEYLCQRLRSASSQTGPRSRPNIVRGVDPNELKKILSFFIKHRDKESLRKLINKLPDSSFAQRSGSTAGYYKNIQSALGPDFYSLPVEDAILILGWACRLL
jgi:hypothetical protein